jgi:hypothetical protein
MEFTTTVSSQPLGYLVGGQRGWPRNAKKKKEWEESILRRGQKI